MEFPCVGVMFPASCYVMSEEFVKRKPLSAQAHAPVSLILR